MWQAQPSKDKKTKKKSYEMTQEIGLLRFLPKAILTTDSSIIYKYIINYNKYIIKFVINYNLLNLIYIIQTIY